MYTYLKVLATPYDNLNFNNLNLFSNFISLSSMYLRPFNFVDYKFEPWLLNKMKRIKNFSKEKIQEVKQPFKITKRPVKKII